LFFIYFALPMIPGIHLALSPFMSGVLGLGIHFSTYIGEVYRSGIERVEKDQWESARALNFPTRKKWTKIILPKALPPSIPMLSNYVILIITQVQLPAQIDFRGM